MTLDPWRLLVKRTLTRVVAQFEFGFDAAGLLRCVISDSFIRHRGTEAHRESRPDKKDDATVHQLHHFEAPVPFGDKVLNARIMVKEFDRSDKGKRIYYVTAVEIKEARVEGAEPTSTHKSSSPVAAPCAGFQKKCS